MSPGAVLNQRIRQVWTPFLDQRTQRDISRFCRQKQAFHIYESMNPIQHKPAPVHGPCSIIPYCTMVLGAHVMNSSLGGRGVVDVSRFAHHIPGVAAMPCEIRVALLQHGVSRYPYCSQIMQLCGPV